MSFAEVLLVCVNCKKSFRFTVEEHDLRASKGYPNEPLLCPSCRRARNVRHNQDEYNTKKTNNDNYFR